MQRIKIWTFNDMVVRGLTARAPVCTRVDAEGPYEIGKGWSAYMVTAPNGQTFIAEAETGALVGNSLNDVRADMAQADLEILKEQEAMLREHGPKAFEIPESEWWSKLGCLSEAA